MSQQVTIRTRLPLPAEAGVTPQQWRVLTEAIFPAAKSAEAICLALEYCKARRLDVFKRPVHIVPMWNTALRREVETVWPGINELQVTAARTGQWAGMDGPEWGPDRTRKFSGMIGRDQDRRKVEAEVTFPESCSVTVYRMIGGVKCAFSEPVYWLEAYAKQGRSEVPNDMWQKRTRGQLHKVAKAASLRAAFPEEMGNDYAAEEMEGLETQAVPITLEGTAEPPEHKAPPASSDRERINAEIPLAGEKKAAADYNAYNALADQHNVPIELLGELHPKIWMDNLKGMLATPPSREFVEVVGAHPAVISATSPAAPATVREQINGMLADAMGLFPYDKWTQPPEDEDEPPEIVGEDKVMAG